EGFQPQGAEALNDAGGTTPQPDAPAGEAPQEPVGGEVEASDATAATTSEPDTPAPQPGERDGDAARSEQPPTGDHSGQREGGGGP
ncbi:MAG: hypothetical protein BRC31_06225, partial [Actinobacteria bacterium QS_5_72_10]